MSEETQLRDALAKAMIELETQSLMLKETEVERDSLQEKNKGLAEFQEE